MKKLTLILLAVVLIIGAAVIMTSCKGDAGISGDEATDGTNNTLETEDETDTEAAVTLNTDFLGEYKMTFGELTAKHGKIVGYETFQGANFYKFENGYAYYLFYPDYDLSKLVTDPDTGVTYMPVEDDELCRGIWYTPIEALFNGPFESISIEDFSKNEGIIFKYTVEDGISSSKAYATSFCYEGWDNEKVYLSVFHDDKETIDTSSEVRVFIHPLDIEAEENQ